MNREDEPTNRHKPAPRDAFAMPSDKDRDRLTVQGGVISTIARMGMFTMSLGAAMVLARQLTPSEFGIFAMSAVLFGLLIKIRSLGLIEALVQAPTLKESTLSLLFWRNLKINVMVLIFALCAAPVIAKLFGEKELILVVVAVAFICFLRGLAGIHEGVMRRQVRFPTLVKIDVIAVALSIVVVIIAAISGMSYWSLVLQEAVRELTVALLLVLHSRWVPSRVKASQEDNDNLHKMTKYGLNLSGANAFNYAGQTVDDVLIGTLSGSAALGLYDKASTWAHMPFQQIYLPIMKVAMSKFSRLQDAAQAYRTSVQRTILALYCVITPIMALLFIEARAVILVLFGDQWTDVVPLFKILIIGVLLNGVLQINKWILKSEGRTSTFMRWTFVTTPTLLVAACTGAFWGPMGIALAYVIACACLFLPTAWVTSRGSHLRMHDIILPMWAPMLASLFAAATTAWLSNQFDTGYNFLDVAISGLILLPLALVFFVLLPGGLGRVRELRIAFAPLFTRQDPDKDPIDSQA